MQELEREVHLVQGFFDTPLLLWAIKRTPGNLDRVFFERSIGLNRHFLQASTTLKYCPALRRRLDSMDPNPCAWSSAVTVPGQQAAWTLGCSCTVFRAASTCRALPRTELQRHECRLGKAT
jgi:hypothetical protein